MTFLLFVGCLVLGYVVATALQVGYRVHVQHQYNAIRRDAGMQTRPVRYF